MAADRAPGRHLRRRGLPLSLLPQGVVEPAMQKPSRPSARLLRATALAALLPLIACNRGTVPEKAAVRPSGAPAGGSATKAEEIQEDPVKTGIEAGDAGLAGRIRSRLAGDPQLRALGIEVDAEGGSVTLWGHVARVEDRTALEQVVRHVPGVAAVKDLVKVDTPTP
jgi:hypothetical protein